MYKVNNMHCNFFRSYQNPTKLYIDNISTNTYKKCACQYHICMIPISYRYTDIRRLMHTYTDTDTDIGKNHNWDQDQQEQVALQSRKETIFWQVVTSLLLSVTYLFLYVTICNYLSLYLTICKYLLLSVTICNYL